MRLLGAGGRSQHPVRGLALPEHALGARARVDGHRVEHRLYHLSKGPARVHPPTAVLTAFFKLIIYGDGARNVQK